MEIVVKKPNTGAKKSKGHKGKRIAHNKVTGKYVKQRARTAENKARHIALAKALGDKAAGTSLTQADYRQKKVRTVVVRESHHGSHYVPADLGLKALDVVLAA